MIQWTRSGTCLNAWSAKQSLEQAVVSFDQPITHPMAIYVSQQFPERESTGLTCTIPVKDSAEATRFLGLLDSRTIEEELQGLIAGAPVLARWMWADVGLSREIPPYRYIARKNPLRWSTVQDVENTIKGLALFITQDRPVRLEIWAANIRVKFATTASNVAAAVGMLSPFTMEPRPSATDIRMAPPEPEFNRRSATEYPQAPPVNRRSAALPPPKLEPGMKVTIVGLRDRPDFNGQAAVLVSMSEARCEIRLASGAVKTIARDNLQPDDDY